MEVVEITKLKENPENPRLISKQSLKKLMRSIQEFPEMLNLRPIVVDDDYMVLGGNMRLQACRNLGLSDIPIIKASQLTEEQKTEFIIKDNLNYGDWDNDALAKEWELGKLEDWGLTIKINDKKVEGDIKFSVELDMSSNYVVLKFDKSIDFIHIQTLLGLEATYSKRQNGKPWAKGIGRVVNGIEALKKLRNED